MACTFGIEYGECFPGVPDRTEGKRVEGSNKVKIESEQTTKVRVVDIQYHLLSSELMTMVTEPVWKLC